MEIIVTKIKPGMTVETDDGYILQVIASRRSAPRSRSWVLTYKWNGETVDGLFNADQTFIKRGE